MKFSNKQTGKMRPLQFDNLAYGSIERGFVKEVLGMFVFGKPYPVIPDGINWEKLNPWLLIYGLAPIFYHGYSRTCVPGDVYSGWERSAMEIWHKHEIFSKSGAKIFSILEKHGIDAVLLRGLSISQWLYPDPMLRPMHDVDILIRETDKERLVDIMESYGYSPRRLLRSQIVYRIDGTLFEIHWSFFTPKRYRETLGFDSWFTCIRRLENSKGFFNILSPEFQCLDLISHGFVHHEFERPMQLVDIALVLTREKLDWDLIQEWCKNSGTSRMTAFSLWYVNRFFTLGMDERLEHVFELSFRGSEAVFRAYQDLFFGPDTLTAYGLRKKNLMQVTEGFQMKCKQGICFLSVKEISKLGKAMLSRGYLLKKTKA